MHYVAFPYDMARARQEHMCAQLTDESKDLQNRYAHYFDLEYKISIRRDRELRQSE